MWSSANSYFKPFQYDFVHGLKSEFRRIQETVVTHLQVFVRKQFLEGGELICQ